MRDASSIAAQTAARLTGAASRTRSARWQWPSARVPLVVVKTIVLPATLSPEYSSGEYSVGRKLHGDAAGLFDLEAGNHRPGAMSQRVADGGSGSKYVDDDNERAGQFFPGGQLGQGVDMQ